MWRDCVTISLLIAQVAVGLDVPPLWRQAELEGLRIQKPAGDERMPQDYFDKETVEMKKDGSCRLYQSSITMDICTDWCSTQDHTSGEVTCKVTQTKLPGGIISVEQQTDPDGNPYWFGKCSCAAIPILQYVSKELMIALKRVGEIACEAWWDSFQMVLEDASMLIPGVGEVDAATRAAMTAAKTIYENGGTAMDFMNFFKSPCGDDKYTEAVDHAAEIFDPFVAAPNEIAGGLGCFKKNKSSCRKTGKDYHGPNRGHYSHSVSKRPKSTSKGPAHSASTDQANPTPTHHTTSPGKHKPSSHHRHSSHNAHSGHHTHSHHTQRHHTHSKHHSRSSIHQKGSSRHTMTATHTRSSHTATSTHSRSSTAEACTVSHAPGVANRAIAKDAANKGASGKNTAPGGKNQVKCGIDAYPDGQLDCGDTGAGTCATMCYAAVCFGDEKNTGVQLEGEGKKSHSGRLTRGGSTIANRKKAGCTSSVNKGLRRANLTVTGDSCDEWPPASSTDGGDGAVIHMVDDQNAQSHAVKAAMNYDGNGVILLRNWKSVPECVAFKRRVRTSCGTDKRFAMYRQNKGKKGGIYRMAFKAAEK